MVYVPPKYPGEIPSENELFPWEDDTHYVSVAKFTAFVKELRAALIELGTDPAGAYDTVKAFLTALNTDKITGAQVPENETDPSVDASLKGITLTEVRDHPAVFPAGIIAMWSGSLATIPDGWALCDGGGGRPDLRGKFVYGAAASIEPGGTGGATTHTHARGSFAGPSHTHTGPSHTHGAGSYFSDLGYGTTECGTEGGEAVSEVYPEAVTGSSAAGGTEVTGAGGTGAITGTSAAGSSLPPYYEVAFIIKT